jgi:hypothetical protein
MAAVSIQDFAAAGLSDLASSAEARRLLEAAERLD